jgi:hypothetical protein
MSEETVSREAKLLIKIGDMARELNEWKSFGEFATQVIRECVVASYPEYREAMKRYNELIK